MYECIETLLKIKNLVSIKGNHDEWLHQFLLHEFHPVYWNHGGEGTLSSYLHHAGKAGRFFKTGTGFKTALVREDIPLSHRRFFEEMRLYYIDEENRCFLHAGFNPHVAFFEQRQENYYWDRELWTQALAHHQGSSRDPDELYAQSAFKEIFIGHTPTLTWENEKPMTAGNIFNLDTGAGHGGRLTMMDVATKVYWQSDPTIQLYPQRDLRKSSLRTRR